MATDPQPVHPATKVRLVHLSDLHLGFRAYRPSDRGGNQRERDMAAAFRWALQEAIRLRPELVLITGDVFDHPLPPTTAILTLQRGIRHLRAHLPRTQILLIAGERDTPRDPANPGPVALLDSLPGVEAAAGAPRAVRHRDVGLHAFLLPYRASARPPSPVVRPDSSARWNVLLLRGDREGSGQPIEIDPEAWSYVAVGGSHRVTEWTSNVRTAGALERPLAGPWGEGTEERGFLSFDLSSGVSEFHPVPNRPVVDLAPVRVGDGSVEAGTRRLRELLQGVPAGIEGKILRVRLRGDVVTPDEGVSQGLLDAVRRHAAHLEIQVESSEPSGLEEGADSPWTPDRVTWGDGNTIPLASPGSDSTTTLFTSDSEAVLLQLVGALRGVGRDAGSGSVEAVRVLPPPPEDPVRSGLWQGGDDPDGLLRLLLPAVVGPPRNPSLDGEEGPPRSAARDEPEDLAALESRLLDRRADWVEAVGDLEAATLQWAQDRQNADSKLEVYRERARELRSRLRMLEADRSEATCPTCGRAMGSDVERLLSTLREEWENVVQDGRWWKRRRDQLDHKPPSLQDLEEHALRKQTEVEGAAEALERLRVGGEEDSRPRRLGEEDAGNTAGSVSNRYALPGNAELRGILRKTGSLLSQITEGQVMGLVPGPKVRVLDATGKRRIATASEIAAVRLAVHLALWLRGRAGGLGVDSLLIWELYESTSERFLRGALELLNDSVRFPVPILLVAPPRAVERVPEGIGNVLEVTLDDQGRPVFRQGRTARPVIQLSTLPVSSLDIP